MPARWRRHRDDFLSAGIPVTISKQQDALDRGTGVIRKNYDTQGRMSSEQVDQAMGLLTPTLSYDDLADCDLVIEAVYESMEVKEVRQARRSGEAIASNTSDVDEIATATKRPGYVLGMHFFSPLM